MYALSCGGAVLLWCVVSGVLEGSALGWVVVCGLVVVVCGGCEVMPVGGGEDSGSWWW